MKPGATAESRFFHSFVKLSFAPDEQLTAPFLLYIDHRMARHESDREDLIKDATAYTTRVEFAASSGVTVFVGIRRDDVTAIYFDQDPMYQFDKNGRIRRALVDGVLYRTQGDTLSRLSRNRSEQETVLERTDLTPDELTVFVETMDESIRAFVKDIADESTVTLRSVAPETVRKISLLVKERLLAVLRTSPRVSTSINATR